jgi:hypothetical protein
VYLFVKLWHLGVMPEVRKRAPRGGGGIVPMRALVASCMQKVNNPVFRLAPKRNWSMMLCMHALI